MKTRKKIPTFKDEAAEREFWSREDSTEYVDWSSASRATLSNLKPTLRTISLRLPEAMIAELKLLANKRDVPYQSLLKVFLAERIREELSGDVPRKPRSRER
ncbi:MAG TPA: BrnA antitoxin family protein [Thermoanaerobaculia bacterium]|jgi:predicted DNA binding CopG/RHH family protein